jgi:hypothetical protein
MITLAQLEAEYGAEALLEATSKLNLDLKDAYTSDDEQLLALISEIQNLTTSSPSSTSNASGSDSKTDVQTVEVRQSRSQATAKRLNEQKESQGAMVQAQREAAQTILKTERNNASQLATLANREFTKSFLAQRSQGLTDFAASYLDTTDIFSEVSDQEFLHAEGDSDPFERSGGFNLRSFIMPKPKESSSPRSNHKPNAEFCWDS